MYFDILFSTSLQTDCVLLPQFKQLSLDLHLSFPKCPIVLVRGTPLTLKLLNQARPRIHYKGLKLFLILIKAIPGLKTMQALMRYRFLHHLI